MKAGDELNEKKIEMITVHKITKSISKNAYIGLHL